jgi:plasmid stabilization system protein ParE
MVMPRRVIWSTSAKQQLKEIYQFIKNDSVQNADSVKHKIFESTYNLISQPEKYPADKFKTNNNGSFRAFEIFKYRISYRITETHILILRVRNTKMKPENY